MNAEKSTGRLVPLAADRQAELAEYLPDGAEILGGFTLSQGEGSETPEADAPESKCVSIVYKSEHEVHIAEVCGGGTEFEVVSDVVIGSV